MPFPSKPQSIDAKPFIKNDSLKKSRLKRLFERHVTKFAGAGASTTSPVEAEPSSVCLDKLVVGFIEEGNDKKCGRRRCNCFNGNCGDSSDDDSSDAPAISPADPFELLKGLVMSESVAERNLLADASRIIESNKSKIGKGKDNCVKVVAENLLSLGHDVAVCKSKWEKTSSVPAGEYEYIDVVIDSDRIIIDVDFKSEFEIARSTKNYRSILQLLPIVFVGKPERIEKIVTLVSEAAKQSLKKKGLSYPPWRKLEYMKSKWMASYERVTGGVNDAPCSISAVNFDGEFEMRGVDESEESDKITVVVSAWTPPAVKPRSLTVGRKVVTGLSLVLTEKSSAPAKF